MAVTQSGRTACVPNSLVHDNPSSPAPASPGLNLIDRYAPFYEITLVFRTLSNMKYTIALTAAFPLRILRSATEQCALPTADPTCVQYYHHPDNATLR